MARTFYRKKFTNYLGEQRAIDDIVLFFTADLVPSPTPTPSITPSNTPTPSITPSSTPIISVTTTPTPTQTNTPTTTTTLTATPTSTPEVTTTPTQTSTPTPTTTTTLTATPTQTESPTPTQTQTGTPAVSPTPYPVCPSELILSATTPNLLYGLYTRATIYTGGTFEAVWYNSENLTLNYGTNPDGNEYIAYQTSSGSDYTSLFWASDSLGNSGKWTIMYSSGNTIFNGGAQTADIAILDSNAITDGVWYYPPSGFLQYNGGYIQYAAVCPTPTPTPTPESTPTSTPTGTPNETPTQTASPTPEPTTTPTQTQTGTPTQTPTPTGYLNANLVAGSGYVEGYSVDGNSWSPISEGQPITDFSLTSISNNGTTWGAIGASYSYITSAATNVVYTSTNGSIWTTGATQGFRSYIGSPSKIVYTAPYWYILGSSTYAQLLSGGTWTTMAYSSDGLNFNPVNITIPSGRVRNQSIVSIAYGNGLYLAVGSSTGTTTTQSRLLYSYNGVDWTGSTNTAFGNNLSSVVFANDRFIVGQSVNAASKILVSTDGFNFSSSTNANDSTVFGTLNPNNLYYFDNKIIGIPGGGVASAATYNFVNYSTDGFTWSGATSVRSLMAQSPYQMAIANSKIYAVGRQSSTGPSRIWESSDGITWIDNTGNYGSIFTGSSIQQIAGIYVPPPTPTPTRTPTQTPTNTPSVTPEPTTTPTQTGTPTGTPAVTPTTTQTPTNTETPTGTPTGTPTPTPTTPDNINKLQTESSDFIHTEANEQIITEQ